MRNKFDKKTLLNILFLAATVMAAVFLLIQVKGLPGSQVDWIAQHSVLPDYFRKLFYATGEIYPDFSIQLGGGQNIFNFAYYGLLNPCIMLSWLFPWIAMDLWIMGLSVALYAASVLLFYYWVSSRGMEQSICLFVSLIFMLAAPLLYHSCVQIMFVNYMPFLCLGLIGTDRYFEKKKAGLVCVSVVLMILTSFFFSVGGIACLCLYALYCYLKTVQEANQKVTVSGTTFAALKYLGIIFTAVLLSCFYLAPTAAALFEGRGGGNGENTVDPASLFLPFGDTCRILYDAYGIGISCLAVISMLSGMFLKKTAGRVLSISLFLATAFPVFSYALNGFLYNRGKALIPFLPLMCFQTGLWLSSLKTKENRRGIMAAFLMVSLYFAVTLQGEKNIMIYLADLILAMISILLYCKWKNDIRIVAVPTILILILTTGMNLQKADVGLEKSELSLEKRAEIAQLIEEITQMDNTFYRTEYYDENDVNFKNMNRIFQINQNITSLYSSAYNPYYSNFRNTVFDVEKNYRNILMEGLSENVVFRKLMGVKYVISETEPVGYEPVSPETEGTGLNLYKDEEAAPLVYGTSKTLSHPVYEQLEFPYNQLAFLYYAVLERNIADGTDTAGMTEFISEQMSPTEQLDISEQLEGNPQGEVTVKLPPSNQEQILFVRFHVKNQKNQDVVIKVGNVTNKLCSENHIYYNENTVFTYAVGVEAGQEEIVFRFGKGSYETTDSEAYLVPLPEEKMPGNNISENNVQQVLYQYEFRRSTVHDLKTSHVLSGNIDMKEEGYLITSIPYDENLTLFVDEEETKAEMVNEGFTGAELEKGNHEILLCYKAPGKKIGSLLTILGMVISGSYYLRKLYVIRACIFRRDGIR